MPGNWHHSESRTVLSMKVFGLPADSDVTRAKAAPFKRGLDVADRTVVKRHVLNAVWRATATCAAALGDDTLCVSKDSLMRRRTH